MSLVEKICFAENIIGIGINASFSTFLYNKKKLLWEHLNKLMLNLLFMNLVESMVGACTYFSSDVYSVMSYLHSGFLLEKTFILFLIAFERLIALRFPVKYHYLHSKHIFYAIATTWIISLITMAVLIIAEINWKYNIILTTVIIGLDTIVVPSVNTVTYFVSKRYKKSLNPTELSQSPVAQSISTTFSYANFAIVISTMVLLIPTFILNVLYLLKVQNQYTSKTVFEILIRFSCISDPLLVIFCSSEIRHEVIDTQKDVGRQIYRTMTAKRRYQHRT